MKKLALVALLLAIPAMAQAKTLEDLLVEKGVISANEARATADAGNAKVYWNDGTRLEFPDNGFTTKINTELKTSYAFTKADKALRKAGWGTGNKSSFGVDQARMTLSGTALNQEFSYKIQADFASQKEWQGRDEATIEDAYIQWEPCEGMGARLGQFKTGLSRQYNTEDYALQIPVRSAVSNTMDWGRQGGIRAFYSDVDGLFSVYGSMYNGLSDGEKDRIDGDGEDHFGTDTRHAFDVSARANVLGKMNPYEEGDIDFTEDLAVNVGATYGYSKAKNVFDLGELEFDMKNKYHAVSADVNVKYQGFSFNAEYFWTRAKYEYLDKVDPKGFYAQAGYFFTPEFEVAARYSYMDCDNAFGGMCDFSNAKYITGVIGVDDMNEAAISLNYYFWKRNLKAQVAYIFRNQDVAADAESILDDDDVNTNIWMFQLSAYL